MAGGQQVQDNGATRGGPRSRCCHGGGKVVLICPTLVGPEQEGDPCGLLGHPGSCSEVIQMPGFKHRAKPLPWVSATTRLS